MNTLRRLAASIAAAPFVMIGLVALGIAHLSLNVSMWITDSTIEE